MSKNYYLTIIQPDGRASDWTGGGMTKSQADKKAKELRAKMPVAKVTVKLDDDNTYKPGYTMSPAALAVRQAAGARSAALRSSGHVWRTVRVDAETLARIKAHRLAGESLADVVRRLTPQPPST